MRIFAYEFLTGGGRYHLPSDMELSSHLLVEGSAMLQAVCHDLAQIPEVRVHTLWDRHFPDHLRPAAHCTLVESADDEQEAFDRQVLDCAYTLIIAPEFGNHLLSRARRAAQLGAVLISPGPELIALASDKCAAAEWLQQAGVRTPPTARCQTIDQVPSTIPWPVIIKPVNGAGSRDVRRVEEKEAATILNGSQEHCVQQFCAGRPASVAAICGVRQQILLPPCWQHLDADSFAYRGGSRIIDPSLVQRAEALTDQALRRLPRPVGYLGFDLILGSAEDGSCDFVIEVNPRLTTSYIGLRLMTKQNLAAAFLDLLAGNEVALSFVDGPLEFEAGGRVRGTALRAPLSATEG